MAIFILSLAEGFHWIIQACLGRQFSINIPARKFSEPRWIITAESGAVFSKSATYQRISLLKRTISAALKVQLSNALLAWSFFSLIWIITTSLTPKFSKSQHSMSLKSIFPSKTCNNPENWHKKMKTDIVNIGLHFFLKDVRPMLPPVMNRSIVDA